MPRGGWRYLFEGWRKALGADGVRTAQLRAGTPHSRAGSDVPREWGKGHHPRSTRKEPAYERVSGGRGREDRSWGAAGHLGQTWALSNKQTIPAAPGGWGMVKET